MVLKPLRFVHYNKTAQKFRQYLFRFEKICTQITKKKWLCIQLNLQNQRVYNMTINYA